MYPFSGLLYSSLILGGFFAYGSIPMFYELACELSYPVGEEVVTGLLSGATNFSILLFYIALMIKQFGEVWDTCLVLRVGYDFLHLLSHEKRFSQPMREGCKI